MKTLLVDGQWNLKRNFKSTPNLKSSNNTLCGGVIGFILSLKSIMNKVLPDRVVIAWDGFNAGKLRYDIYKPYKAKRKKDFENEQRMIETEGVTSPEDMEAMEMLRQKMLLQNILEELFVRQMEVDYIEADDLIAQYVLKSENDDEQIFIYSRDKDFLQLISDKVSVITSDSLWTLNREEYEKKYNHTLDNELLFKSFEGDKGDGIEKVKGINRQTLIDWFPNIAKEKYTYQRLVDECYEAKKDKKRGKALIYDKIINAQDVLYRNAKLINLKKPFLNKEARHLVDIVKHGTLEEREISTAINTFREHGLMIHVGEDYVDLFFSPFYSLMLKEKDYANRMKL